MFKHLKTTSAICLVALTVAAAPAAFAAVSVPEGGDDYYLKFWTERMMKAMDRNKDGNVSRQEFLNYMATQFDKMDQNKDKMLSTPEFMDKKMMRSTFPTGSSPE